MFSAKSYYYHICNKSIANYGIFLSPCDSQRFLEILEYYNASSFPLIRFSVAKKQDMYFYKNLLSYTDNSFLMYLAYCVMPDHYHLLVKISEEFYKRLSQYISIVENSYSRYFNQRHKRKGPLWQSRYRYKRIKSQNVLLHVCRYINLNPTTSSLVSKPENWQFSSYNDLISQKYSNILELLGTKNSTIFKKFVENNIDYQKTLKRIKRHIFM